MKRFERSLDATEGSKRPLMTTPWQTLGVRRKCMEKFLLSLGRDERPMGRSN
jgi:hypothetical protein